jgi:hypothetical protein
VLALEMPKGYAAPQYPTQRSMVRRFKFRLPFLEDDVAVKKAQLGDGAKDPLSL